MQRCSVESILGPASARCDHGRSSYREIGMITVQSIPLCPTWTVPRGASHTRSSSYSSPILVVEAILHTRNMPNLLNNTHSGPPPPHAPTPPARGTPPCYATKRFPLERRLSCWKMKRRSCAAFLTAHPS